MDVAKKSKPKHVYPLMKIPEATCVQASLPKIPTPLHLPFNDVFWPSPT